MTLRTPLWFRRLSLRWKVSLLLAGTTAGTLLVTATIGVVGDWRGGRASVVDELVTTADVLGSATAAAVVFDVPEDAATTLRAFARAPHVEKAALWRDGVFFAGWSRGGRLGASAAAPPEEGIRVRGTEVLVVRPVRLEGRTIAHLEVHADLSESLHAVLLRALGTAALTVAIALVATALLTLAFHHFLARPILELADVARRVSRTNDFSLRARRRTADEIGELAESFNGMLREIETRDAALERHRDCLEREVESRVAELRAVNAELVRARDRADTANEAKSEFLANMSHELRTPMNGVLGIAQLLRADESDPERRDRLDMIRDCGRSLLRIIDEILDFSRLEAGRMTVEPVPFDLEDTLRSAALLLRPQARDKGLDLSLSVDPSVPRIVVSDPLRLRQILLNLVGNAIKFTEEGGVRVEVEWVPPEGGGVSRPPEASLRVRVRDTGLGIPREQFAHVFEPFVQGDGSATRRHGGTGLGLTISARLARLLGGDLTVSSEPGVGSTFELAIRAERGRLEARPPDGAGAAERGGPAADEAIGDEAVVDGAIGDEAVGDEATLETRAGRAGRWQVLDQARLLAHAKTLESALGTEARVAALEAVRESAREDLASVQALARPFAREAVEGLARRLRASSLAWTLIPSPRALEALEQGARTGRASEIEAALERLTVLLRAIEAEAGRTVEAEAA